MDRTFRSVFCVGKGLCCFAVLLCQCVAMAGSGDLFDADAWPVVTSEVWKPRTESRTDTPLACLGRAVAPDVAKAGEEVVLRFAYDGEPPTVPFSVRITFWDGDALRWNDSVVIARNDLLRRETAGWILEFPYTLPTCLDSCVLDVKVEPEGTRCVERGTERAKLSYKRIAHIRGWERQITAGVTRIGGVPCFALDGVPVYPLWGTVRGWEGRRSDGLPKHSDAPLNFVTVWCDHLRWWPRGLDFNPAELDRQAELHVRASPPDALFIWDISIYPPPDWRERNPDEMARDENGRVNTDCGDEEINYSFASKKALSDMETMLEKVISYLERSPYANRIIGYRINSGHTVEWLGWDPTDMKSILDFSPVARKGFESFARKNYPEITEFSVPTLAERQELDGDEVFWDQRRHVRSVAYHDYYSRLLAYAALRLCRRARGLVGGRKLIGTYYGYVMTLFSGGVGQMRAHFAMKRFLDAQSVDFIMSPQEYGIRDLGETCGDMKPFASIWRHGIVSVIEDDTRTHNQLPNHVTQMLTEAQSIGIIRRNMGVSLCRNQPFYTFGMSGGTSFDFPAFARDASVLRTVGEHCIAESVGRHAEIAVVVSEEAVKAMPMLTNVRRDHYRQVCQRYNHKGEVEHIPCAGAPLAAEPYKFAYTRYARIGAPVDYLLAEDMADDPGDYKLYVFACCNKLTPGLLRVAERLRNRRCTILWTVAPGYMSRDGNSLENMKRLTGLEFGKVDGPIEPSVTLEDGVKAGETANPIAPVFHVLHPDETFGRYSNGQIGLAASMTGRARTVFCGSSRVELPFLVKLAKEADVRLFAESGDPLEANDRLVTLHARFAGRKTVKLAKRMDVLDVFNRRIVARGTDVFSFEAPLHSSWLFYCGADATELLKRLCQEPKTKQRKER